MMKRLSCTICLLVGGCGELLWGELPFWKEQWDRLRRQTVTATTWDELPQPWVIEYKGEHYRSAYGISMDERYRRVAEVKQFLRMVNARRREWYVASQPELSAKTKEYILVGTIVIGMTDEQVTASKGKPPLDRINRSVGRWGVHEQWVYGEYSRSYLYFENGILTSWQN